VDFGQSVIPSTGDITVQVWSYATAAIGNNQCKEILAQGNGSDPTYFFGVCDTTFRVSHSWQYIIEYPIGEWINTTVVKDSYGTKLYYNDNEVANTTSTEQPSLNPFYIGCQTSGSSEHWQGYIDEVRIWDTANVHSIH
jgi:hypothetical protein